MNTDSEPLGGLTIEQSFLEEVRVDREERDDVHTLRTLDRSGASIHVGRGPTAEEARQHLDGQDLSPAEREALRRNGY